MLIDSEKYRHKRFKNLFKKMGKYHYVHFDKANITYWASNEVNPLEEYVAELINVLELPCVRLTQRTYNVHLPGNPDWIEVKWYHILEHIIDKLKGTFVYWINQKIIFNWDNDSSAAWHKAIYGSYPADYLYNLQKEKYNMDLVRDIKMKFDEWLALDFDKNNYLDESSRGRQEYYDLMISKDINPLS